MGEGIRRAWNLTAYLPHVDDQPSRTRADRSNNSYIAVNGRPDSVGPLAHAPRRGSG